jgi:hypothetical protein
MKILTELLSKILQKINCANIFLELVRNTAKSVKRIQPVGLEISKITSLNRNKFLSFCRHFLKNSPKT